MDIYFTAGIYQLKSAKITELLTRKPELSILKDTLETLIDDMIRTFDSGGTVFLAGNGGSASDCEHICGELLKGFKKRRPLSDDMKRRLAAADPEAGKYLAERLQCGLRAVSLLSHPALSSAFANDVDPDMVYAQQLNALAKKGDLFVGISTGGGAKNIKYAFITAKALGVKSVLLTGNRHGLCEKYCDLSVAVPESETYLIQEWHIAIYHAVCLAVEEHYFHV